MQGRGVELSFSGGVMSYYTLSAGITSCLVIRTLDLDDPKVLLRHLQQLRLLSHPLFRPVCSMENCGAVLLARPTEIRHRSH